MSGKVQVGKGMATIPAGINVRDMASPPPRSLMQTQVQEVAENVNGCAIQDSALSTVKSANTMAFMPICGGEEGGLNRRTLCIIAGLVHHAISHLGSWSACNWDVNQIWHDSGLNSQAAFCYSIPLLMVMVAMSWFGFLSQRSNSYEYKFASQHILSLTL